MGLKKILIQKNLGRKFFYPKFLGRIFLPKNFVGRNFFLPKKIGNFVDPKKFASEIFGFPKKIGSEIFGLILFVCVVFC